MKEQKFVCPDCGGPLVRWEEKVYEEIVPIFENGMTGETTRGEEVGETGCAGVKCCKCGKSTYANGDNDFDNKKDIEEIESHVWGS